MRIVTAVLAITTLLAPVLAPGLTITSVDRATFQTAVAGGLIDEQDFDALANGTLLGTLDGVTFGSSQGTPIVTNAFLTSTSPNGEGRTGVGFFLPSDTASFGFATPISAFAIDVNTFDVVNGGYHATLNTGDVVLSRFEVFPGQATGQFIGFVTSTPFSSLSITAPGGFSYTLDTLVYGNAAAVTPGGVPEPASMALAALGLAALALSRRRRI